jgi:hypothetical protein
VGTREEYWSASSSCKEEEKKRGRCRGGSIYRWEEACEYRRLGSYNIASDVARLTYTEAPPSFLSFLSPVSLSDAVHMATSTNGSLSGD